MTGRIENITFSDSHSNDASSLSFINLKETFYCANIQITNSELKDFDGKIVSLWQAKVSMNSFQINDMNIFRLFDVELYSFFDISNLLIKNINCSNDEGGSLFYVASFTTLYASNLTIMDVYSDIDTIAIYDATFNMTFASLNRIFVKGNNTKVFYLCIAQGAILTMNNVFIGVFYRSFLIGSASSIFFFNNISVNNEKNYLNSDLYYSYSMFEFMRIQTAFFTNCMFSNSNLASYGGVFAFLKCLF